MRKIYDSPIPYNNCQLDSMKYLLSIWEKLIFIGTSPELPIEIFENIKNTNRICIINAFLTIQGGLFVYYLMPTQMIHWVVIFSGSCYLWSLLLNYYHYFSIAKILPWLVAIVSVFYVSSVLGSESDVHTLYVIIIIGAIMSHAESSRKALFVLISLPIILTIILILTDFSLFAPDEAIPLDIKNNIASNVFVINLISSIVATYFYLHRTTLFKANINRSRDELNEKYSELQKVNQEMDRFVYSVSHDLRAPIVSSLGLISIAMKEDEVEKIKYYLSLQEKSLWKLEKFIAEILVYSRNNRMEINIQNIDIQELISDILTSQNLALESPSIKAKTEFVLNAPIYSDEQRLTAVLNNLISNAIRYRNKKSIQSFVHISVESSFEYIHIKITDNGLGIGEEHLPKIFDMFYRAHTRSEGSGLGLYIVQEVIQKLNGKISVTSELGEGTTFEIEIPNLNKTDLTP